MPKKENVKTIIYKKRATYKLRYTSRRKLKYIHDFDNEDQNILFVIIDQNKEVWLPKNYELTDPLEKNPTYQIGILENGGIQLLNNDIINSVVQYPYINNDNKVLNRKNILNYLNNYILNQENIIIGIEQNSINMYDIYIFNNQQYRIFPNEKLEIFRTALPKNNLDPVTVYLIKHNMHEIKIDQEKIYFRNNYFGEFDKYTNTIVTIYGNKLKLLKTVTTYYPIYKCDTVKNKIDFLISQIPESICPEMYNIFLLNVMNDNNHHNNYFEFWNLNIFVPF